MMQLFLDFAAAMLMRLLGWSAENPSAPRPLRILGLIFFSGLFLVLTVITLGSGSLAIVLFDRQKGAQESFLQFLLQGWPVSACASSKLYLRKSGRKRISLC